MFLCLAAHMSPAGPNNWQKESGGVFWQRSEELLAACVFQAADGQ